jgi:hypothetical protein
MGVKNGLSQSIFGNAYMGGYKKDLWKSQKNI